MPHFLTSGKSQGREVGSDDRISGEPSRLSCFPEVFGRQGAAWNVPAVVAQRSNGWRKMCEHQVLRADALCHRTEVGSPALTIKREWRKSAASVRAQDRVRC